MNLAHKLIKAHLIAGEMIPGTEIFLNIDQTLTQDATGTLAWLQFEALGLDSVRNELALSYVDHNTLQTGFRNPDDHRFLRTCAARFGAVFSPPGTGICHQLHLENFAKPGKTLLGSDSHTPNAGGMGSLAMGAGGLSVALAMAGKPYRLTMPKIVEVYLTGSLQGWAQAKDVILHLLGKLSVKGGVGKIFEYTGPGVATLSVPERATIANMGAELGATTSLFPSDEVTKDFLHSLGRPNDWAYLCADDYSRYDERLELDLSSLEPMVACPHMPDQVVSVASLAAEQPDLHVDQVAMGSCTNSSYADLRLAANIFKGKRVDSATEAFVSPGSRTVLGMLVADGSISNFLEAGVRLLECSCGPCIGMGSSPVSGGISVRTFNRNFEGRCGTRDAGVYLVSPATAAQCAIHGKFTDPATWGVPPAKSVIPGRVPEGRKYFILPAEDPAERAGVEIVRGPNIVALDQYSECGDKLEGRVVLKVGDGVSTDHIMPAGSDITALRSNIPAISQYVFSRTDAGFVARAVEMRDKGLAALIVAGENYGQGSSREHAALAPRHLGVAAVLAKSFARIHMGNLINFGILPLVFAEKSDYDRVEQGVSFAIDVLNLKAGLDLEILIDGRPVTVKNTLSPSEVETICRGGLLNKIKQAEA